MHTVAMRTEATMPEEEAPANLGQAFKVAASTTHIHYGNDNCSLCETCVHLDDYSEKSMY
jgi:hypothetical protein